MSIHGPPHKLILPRLHQLIDILNRQQAFPIIPTPQQCIMCPHKLNLLSMTNLLCRNIGAHLMTSLAIDLGRSSIDRVVEEVLHLVMLWLRLVLDIACLADMVFAVSEDGCFASVPAWTISVVGRFVEDLLDALLHASSKPLLLLLAGRGVADITASMGMACTSWLSSRTRLCLGASILVSLSWWVWQRLRDQILTQDLGIACLINTCTIESYILRSHLSKLVRVVHWIVC